MTEIRLSSMINPHCKDLWNTKRDYIVAKGGRGSFKSSVISMKTVIDMFQMIQDGHKANVY